MVKTQCRLCKHSGNVKSLRKHYKALHKTCPEIFLWRSKPGYAPEFTKDDNKSAIQNAAARVAHGAMMTILREHFMDISNLG
jgi:hypothetical protein